MSTIQNPKNPISNPNNLKELFFKISVGEYANTTVFSPIVDLQERQLKAIQELNANPNKG
jgi:hypothetical protein